MNAETCNVCGTTGGYVRKGQTAPFRVRGACSPCYQRYRSEGRLHELDRATVDCQSFLSRLLRGDVEPDSSGCILWPGAIDGSGYPRIARGRRWFAVTRVVLTELVGAPPTADHEAAHAPHDICGYRHCVNVEHLRWATPVENAADKISDGTDVRGEQVGTSKLTHQQAVEIRELYASGEWTQQQIADRYGVHQPQVSRIVRGRRWSHLAQPGEAA